MIDQAVLAKLWQVGGRALAIETCLAKASSKQVPDWDLVVIGGGITGAGIFREAARKGYRVLLVEQKDFAWGTSSKSSKMVHGGLRYLGSGQVGLAYDSVRERQRLLQEVPGLVEPLQFLMTHYRGVFPGPRIFNMLLAFYDWMGRKWNHHFHPARDAVFHAPGISGDKLLGETQFGDAVTDDARLVLRVIHEGVADGGLALNYLRASVNPAPSEKNLRSLVLHDEVSGNEYPITARVVVNATGAWTDLLRAQLGKDSVIRPLRGSHLILPGWRLPVAYAVSFFHPEDKRPVFVFPWEGVTVVGTTDLDHTLEAGKDIAITAEEVAYLLEAANHQFPGAKLTARDAIGSYSGVRPVVGTGALNPSSEKREHSIWNDQGVISVAGGKLTTFRLIALDVLRQAEEYLQDVGNHGPQEATIFKRQATRSRPDFLSESAYRRLCGRYGNSLGALLDNSDAQQPFEPAARIGWTDTLWLELDYVAGNEMVVHLDDLLLRRTRIGLLLERGGLEWVEEIKTISQARLGWSEERWSQEWKRYQQIWSTFFGIPGQSPAVKKSEEAVRSSQPDSAALKAKQAELV